MLKYNRMLKISLCIIMLIGIMGSFFVSNADDSFLTPTITPSVSADVSDKLGTLGGNILGIFQVVGYIAAVIILVWLGIKYIMASPEGKAEIKKQAFAYILGAILLFSASTIVTVIKGFTTV